MGANQYLYIQHFFKTQALEIKKELLQKHINNAKIGNQSAFRFLLDTYWNQVYGFQLNRVKNETEAEDITIETFSKAFDKIHTFDDNYNFSTWLIAISKNIHTDLIRKKNSASTLKTTDIDEKHIHKIADDAPSPEDNLIIQQNLAKLLRDIKQLKPHYQEVIQLRYFQELSYKEISEQLEEPINNVKVKLLRAKKLLAEIISEK
jgi:RNA polymerase sigma factor (sigma-70 family)